MIFAVYVCTESGFWLKVKEMDSLPRAESFALFCHTQAKTPGMWFEVWSNGDVCMSTK